MPLHPLKGKHLESFARSNKRYNIWSGAVSSGKTVTTCFKLVDFCISGPPGEILLVGKTERTLERNVIDVLIKMFGQPIRKVGSSVYIFGRRCYIVGANDERSEQKIRGLSLVCAYCDELTLYPESFFQMLKSRLRLPGAQLIATTNPDNPNHYLIETLIENPKEQDKLTVWYSTMDDNPYLEPDYVAAMKSAYPEGSLWYKRYILGLWVAAEGMIYDMFDEKRHIIDTPPEKFDKYYVACDYGTNNPCAFLLFGITRGNPDRVTCIKEYYYDGRTAQRQKTDAEYSRDLKEWAKGYQITEVLVDPSALSFITQLRRDGFPVRQAKNDVLDGIRTVASFLQNGRYQIARCCKNHIKEFYGYAWDEKAQERGEDAPRKENDHTMDAMRYMIFTIYGRGGMQVIGGLAR